MANEAKRNVTEPPTSSPTRTSGTFTRMAVNPAASWNAPKSDVAASTAVAMATPFVMAFVEFPMASRLPRISAPRPSISPDISAMPCALSETGPNVSMDTITPTTDSMPIPASDTKNSCWFSPSPR